MWILWKSGLSYCFRSVDTVDNSVDNFKSFPHNYFFYPQVCLSTYYPQAFHRYPVDNYSVSFVTMFSKNFIKQNFHKQIFYEIRILNYSVKPYGYLSFNNKFCTLSTINFVFEFDLISFSILLQACITVE